MPFPLPIPPYPYDDDTRATIAGFLLHYRAGTLQAKRSTGSPVAGTTYQWAEHEHRYWSAAEAYSRYLLNEIGYPVAKDADYEPSPE